MAADADKRVVLGRKENSMVGFRWTGAEPDGMYEIDVAEMLGARWEGGELVTYDLEALQASYDFHQSDEYMIDND
jgi:hypothetical protein